MADLKGEYLSRHYVTEISYLSSLSGEKESIRFEISLREPLFQPAATAEAMTMLMSPFTGTTATDPVPVRVMSRQDAHAEENSCSSLPLRCRNSRLLRSRPRRAKGIIAGGARHGVLAKCPVTVRRTGSLRGWTWWARGPNYSWQRP